MQKKKKKDKERKVLKKQLYKKCKHERTMIAIK